MIGILLAAYPSLAAIALGLVLIDLARVTEYHPRHVRITEEATHDREP